MEILRDFSDEDVPRFVRRAPRKNGVPEEEIEHLRQRMEDASHKG